MAAFSLSDWKEKAKQLARKAKQYALSMSDLEMKVEEATNSEPWGPHGQLLNEIAEYAHDSEGYKQILGILARRLADRGMGRFNAWS